MGIQTVTAIFFSPTGATRKVVGSIVKGMGIARSTTIDMTAPAIRECPSPAVEGDLVLIAVPVYAEGVPPVLMPFLKSLKGHDKPVVLVAVYGNMSEGVALNQLRLIAEASGFHVVGAASFIGEHSFSTERSPVAAGRPDGEDLKKAEEFGKKVIDKLHKLNDLRSATPGIPECNGLQLFIKMNVPFNTAKLYSKGPVADPKVCNRCGLCARICPVGAVDSNTLKVHTGRCLRCCSCVKRCPRHARKMIFRMNLPASRFLNAKGKVLKEPHFYL